MSHDEQELSEFYIAGQWKSAGPDCRSHAIVNPATEQVCARISFGTPGDIDAAVAAADAAFQTYSLTTLQERIALLERICAVYESRLEEIALAITREMGAPLHALSRTLQAPAGLWHFQTALACLRNYPFEHLQGTTRIVREPVGVCGLVTPWNWPMNQVVCKVAPALATGCTVVLKPSQHSSLSARILGEIMQEAGVPSGVFNMVFGEGRVLGEALARDPRVDMISLTGSTEAGRQVAQMAAGTIKRVSLELGGKSANIILPEAPLAEAVSHGVQHMMSNSGQSCNAPARMLVPRAVLREAEELACAACEQLVVGDPLRQDVQVGPLAHERQHMKVNAMIELGQREGARLIAGGNGRPPGVDRGYFTRPTVLSRVSNDMQVAREEIFGPVLAMIPYDSLDDAIRIANDSPYGLSGYVSGPSKPAAESVARRLRTGMVHLNGAFADVTAPFGGYKQSGNGREWGSFGFDEFVELKAIMGAA